MGSFDNLVGAFEQNPNGSIALVALILVSIAWYAMPQFKEAVRFLKEKYPKH